MVELRTLGGLELHRADGVAVDAVLTQPKRAALLVYLAANGGGGRPSGDGFLRRDPLLGIFWPDQTESRARGSLRQMLYSLKKDLGAEVVVTRGDDEVGISRDVVECDVPAFDTAIAGGRLEDAIALYRGPFLSGFFLKGSVEFDQWVQVERERMSRAYGDALESLAERAAAGGDRDQAIVWLRRWADHMPYSTRTALKYMEALAESGDRAGALRYADRLAQRVQEDLGAAPSPDVTALADRLRHDPVERQETRFVRVTPPAETNDLDALRDALGERYTIEREAGSGGMATVYLAEDTKHHRRVAIKVLRPELAAAIGSDRFLREIEIAAQLNHPHLLPVHDSGQAGQFLYYVTPHAGGESVRDRLNREKQLPVDDAVTIASQVAGALDYAHREGVIHRDIKPENILLQDGQALVADFGIALAVQSVEATRLTETGLSIGTPQYMSPEQAAGDRELDGRSDIYSLGCVLYEMLAGEPPHTGPTVQAILAKVATDEPRDLSEIRRSVPDGVCDAVHQALARLPADRFARAEAFAEALRDPSRRPGGGPRHQAAAAARWKRIAVSSLAVGTLAIVGILALLFQNSEPGASSARWLSLDLEYPIGISFALSHDGSAIVYWEERYTVRVRSLDARNEHVIGPDGMNVSPFFSPEAEWVGRLEQGGLSKVPITGGPPTSVFRDVPMNLGLYGADWGPDDNIYFPAGHADGISRVDADGATPPERLTMVDSTAGELGHRFPRATDRGVLFTSWWGDSARIMAYSFGTGRISRVVEGTTARVLGNDYLLFGTRNGTIRAVRFDAERLQAVGPSIAVVDSVQVDGHGRAQFDVSANGTLAYLPAWAEQRSLVAVDSAGRERPFMRERDQYGTPEVSPDGSAVAYTRGVAGAVELWVRSRDGQASRVTRRGTNFWPIWSPDGAHLAFSSDRGGRGWQAYRQRANGSGEATLVLERPDGAFPMSWSTNGLMAGYGNTRQFWIIQADSSGAEPPPVWCAPPHCGGYLRLSPDGEHVTWVGDGQVWVALLEDPVATRVPISSSDGPGQPRWSPDGRRVYYVDWDTGQLFSVLLELDDPIRVLDRRVLFNAFERGFETQFRHFSVDPASGDLVFTRPDGPPRPSLRVVLNFEAELEARFREQ